MKVLAISGMDKTGKATITNHLVKTLESWNYKVHQGSFPNYGSPTGILIQNFLAGDYDVDPYTVELLMSADKTAMQSHFDKIEKQGYDFLVLDRYTTDQEVYALAQGLPLNFVRNCQIAMRKPDCELLLDAPVEVSMSRRGKHNNGQNDKYEADKALLERVRELYKSRIPYQIDATQPLDVVKKEAEVRLRHMVSMWTHGIGI